LDRLLASINWGLTDVLLLDVSDEEIVRRSVGAELPPTGCKATYTRKYPARAASATSVAALVQRDDDAEATVTADWWSIIGYRGEVPYYPSKDCCTRCGAGRDRKIYANLMKAATRRQARRAEDHLFPRSRS